MHADLVCRALETGKSVFVEKPLALNEEELARVVETVDTSGNDRLMVGFNRRFAPLFVTMRDRFGRERSPGTARYVVNAGRLERGSWYLNQEFEGSRFVGEGGHFVDTLSWWFGALPLQVQAAGTDGNVVATLTFDDGSIGSISYTADGNARFPKEVFEASGGGRSARLSNFKAATVWRGRRRLVERSLLKVDKGQRNEVDSFVRAIAAGDPMPIPFESLVATTRATLVVARALVTGQSEKL
jgi:predicted dehydrogenase